jgi:hypothetical protein
MLLLLRNGKALDLIPGAACTTYQSTEVFLLLPIPSLALAWAKALTLKP